VSDPPSDLAVHAASRSHVSTCKTRGRAGRVVVAKTLHATTPSINTVSSLSAISLRHGQRLDERSLLRQPSTALPEMRARVLLLEKTRKKQEETPNLARSHGTSAKKLVRNSALGAANCSNMESGEHGVAHVISQIAIIPHSQETCTCSYNEPIHVLAQIHWSWQLLQCGRGNAADHLIYDS
jgi:hypothetical protein